MSNLLKNIFASVREVGIAFRDDHCFYRAATLAYNSLLTLLPLFSIVLLIVASLPIMDQLEARVEDFMFNNVFPDYNHVLHGYMKTLALQAHKLSWLNLAFLLVTIFMLLRNIEKAFNDIWHAPPKNFNIFYYILRYAVYVIVMPSLLGAILICNSYLKSIPAIQNMLGHADTVADLFQLTPGIIIFIMIFGLYKYVPRAKIPTLAASLGALFTTAVFLTGKILFITYINSFSDYQVLYGAFAALPIFLIWLYFTWAIILFGFEIMRHIYARDTLHAQNK